MQLNKRYKWFSFTIVFIITAVFFLFPHEITSSEMPEACAGCEKDCLVKVCIDWDSPGENGCVPGPNDLGCCRPENYEWQCDPDCIPPDRPPSINGTLNCSSWGNNSWCIGNESLDLNASDPQGATLLISGDLNGSVFSCGEGTLSCSIPLPEGVGIANYQALSSLGLRDSGSATWLRDATLPVIDGSVSGIAGSNNWYISTVEASASVTESGSGLASFSTSLDGASWTPYSAPLTFSDGIHNLQFRAFDIAGNQADVSVPLQVDTENPTISASLSGTMGAGNWYVSSVEASASTADTTSGIATVEYTADGGGWQIYSPPLTFGDGAHQVRFRTFDNAGLSAETGVFSFQIDTTVPHIKLPSRWYIWETGEAVVKDDTSKIASVSITVSDPQNRWKKVQWNWTPNIHQFSNTISWNRVFADGIRAPIGTYNVTVLATDNAGNHSERSAQIIIPQPAADPLPTFTPTPTDEPTEEVVAAGIVSSATPIPPSEPVDDEPKASNVIFGSKSPIAQRSSSPAATSDNILWGATAAAAIGAFAAAAAETKRRRDKKRARWAAKQKKRAQEQAFYDANGAALYAANQATKPKEDDPYAGIGEWHERHDSANSAVIAGYKKKQLEAGLFAYYNGRKDGEDDYRETGPMCKPGDNAPILKPYSGPPLTTPTPHPSFTLVDTLEAGCEIADAIDPLSPSPEFAGTNLGWGEAIDQATTYPGLIGLGARGAKVIKDVVSTPYNFVCQQVDKEGLYYDMWVCTEKCVNGSNWAPVFKANGKLVED